jgi:hypothetical protein
LVAISQPFVPARHDFDPRGVVDLRAAREIKVSMIESRRRRRNKHAHAGTTPL